MKTEISLTDFVDFVAKVGSSKLTKVKQVKSRDDYHPNFDYWKYFRDQIVKYHKSGSTKKADLDSIMIKVKGTVKEKRYNSILKSYKKWLGRKKISYVDIKSRKWSHLDLTVRVNPEIALEINDYIFIIKLHFKAEKLTKSKVKSILLLMNETYKKEVLSGVRVGILDIERSNLIVSDPELSLMPLLKGEAVSFKAIFDAV